MDKAAKVALAKAIMTVHQIREQSWMPSKMRYSVNQGEAICWLKLDQDVGTLVSCLLTSGFCEVLEFCYLQLGADELAECKAKAGQILVDHWCLVAA